MMGQREGFAQSDLLRINRRYCDGQNPGPAGLTGGNGFPGGNGLPGVNGPGGGNGFPGGNGLPGGNGSPSYIDYIDNGAPPNYPNYGGFPNYGGPPFGGPPNNAYPPPNPYPPRPQPQRPFRPIFRPPIFG
ncbi:putative cuticle collagen 80 [Chironomus tepperi]|uniref:putative cuticle collagen 80 n=1 Tax=Chironomus tepperi TaxID=113505 RepID=UPI00391EFA32